VSVDTGMLSQQQIDSLCHVVQPVWLSVVMQTVISNATRWDTFEYLMEQQALPKSEQLFRKRYKKSPSFISIHMGVKADVLPEVLCCSCLCFTDDVANMLLLA